MSEEKQPPLVVHIIYALDTGGLENGLVNIINHASPERYRHSIICLTQASDFASRINVPGVEIYELHKKPGHDLKLYWRMWRLLRRLRPAIVHTRNLAALEMQLVARFVRGCKRIHGEHGRDIGDLDGTNQRNNFIRKRVKPFVHHYICVSKDLARWLVDTVGVEQSRISQIYNGVDFEKFHSKNKLSNPNSSYYREDWAAQDTIVLGTVGRLAEVKNQSALVRLMASLRKNVPRTMAQRLKLVIVGEGPMRKPLEEEISRLNLQDAVWLTGDSADVDQLLGIFDLFILPSLAEGISNTLLEAMASALPVIATDVGGNPELVKPGETGVLVPVNDDKALLRVLKEMLQQRDRWQQMGQTAWYHVQHNHNWNHTAEQYLAVYDEVLKGL